MSEFDKEFGKLNKAQREAVETIDGPVMVVAGPGTGKTQILALRIGNILKQTDIKPEDILCLTFTNAAVSAMQERLQRYIGPTADKVNVFTYHSFGMKVIETYFKVLDFPSVPKLLDDSDTAILFDEILNNNNWQHLRPRTDASRYFSPLRSLISLLKRERITSKYFLSEIEKEIKSLESDPDNLSSRGESKGELKREVLSKIESLERSREVAKFFELYEKLKKEKNVLDYDDVLENLVKIVETSAEALADIQEKYLYILVDEHQDSSRVQNEALERIWGAVEHPNIMVVGDDRQLIYGFSGASIDQFRGFEKTFQGAKLISLVDNYRSTQVILDASHELLKSVMTDEKLVSQSQEHHPLSLVEAQTEREEIIAAAEDLKAKINPPSAHSGGGGGLDPNDCAILVPKNAQVRRALEILHESNLPVSSLEALHLFDQEEMQALLRVFKIIEHNDLPSLTLSFFDKSSGIAPLEAHEFLSRQNMRDFSLDKILVKSNSLFGNDQVNIWIGKLAKWKNSKEKENLESLVKLISTELFEKEEKGALVSGEEIRNTILGLLARELEKNPKLTLPEFIRYLDRLNSYGEPIPLVSREKDGVKVLTMHSAKGLEFNSVWIAHMDERSLAGGKKNAFTLPESVLERVEERDIDAIKRKLYVAITRAKRFCTLSYALESQKGGEQSLARVISALPEEVFKKEKPARNAEGIASAGGSKDLSLLIKLVGEKYRDRYVSASLLNNFFECPWKWYFRNLLGLPEKVTESLEFGDKVHKAIDQILRSNKVILPEDKTVAEVVSVWAERRFPEIAKSRKNEEPLSVSQENFPHLKFFGKIDLIENLDRENIRVTDFKTGSARRKNEIEKRDEDGRLSNLMRQLAMYSYLLESSPKWRGVKVRESRLEFLEAKNLKEAIFDKVISQEEIELLVKDIEDYDELVKSGEWLNHPCNYNSYSKNTECEYCKRAEIFK